MSTMHHLFYTPGIYADGYIVFAFQFVCSFFSSFVIPERVRGIYVKVFVKVSLVVYVSLEPMIRNHSYFNHRYPIGFALFP